MAAEPPPARRTRQSPGEGGKPRRRADGRWDASLELPPGPDGRRRRKSVYGATKTEALQKLRALKAEVAQGRAPPPKAERLTVAALLDRWLESVARSGAPQGTRDYDAWAVEGHLKPALGHMQLARLARRDVQAMVDGLAGRLSPRSVQHVHAVLHKALSDAVRWELVERNAADLVDKPRIPRYRPAFLAVDQARRLLAEARGERLSAVYSVATALGLRPGETLGMRWRDVDLEAGTLHLAVQLQREGGRLSLRPLKRETQERTIRLPRTLVAELAQHRRRQVAERLLAGEAWEDRDLVFATLRGRPLSERNVVRGFKALLARAGLPDMRLYDLRHSCVSLLIAQGVPLGMIAELLGHADQALVLRTYGHMLPSVQRETAEKMDAILRPEVGRDVGQPPAGGGEGGR